MNNSMLANRLKKNLKKLKSWIKSQESNAFRLYDRDIPEIPYIVDIYDKCAVVYERGKKEAPEDLREKNTHDIEDSLSELLQIEQIFFKQRVQQKGKHQYQRQKWRPQKEIFSISENSALFEVNLKDYLDTGLFLDHRPLRKMVKETSSNKAVLNLFSYTCSISIMAALGGARVTSVDLSNTYLEWGMRNFKLNGIPAGEHRFVKADILDYIKEEKDKFDIIILDPPSFSNSKSMDKTLDIQRDHETLISDCMDRLSTNGILYFSTNKRDFKLSAEIQAKYQIQDITQKSIPIDYRDAKIHKLFEIKL